MKGIMILEEFNTVSVVARIFLAMLLGGFIGIEREKSHRPAGFRTHILVCVGACMTSLIGLFVWCEFGDVADPARIAAQVVSGIGFLGVGTILVKEHDHITGLTTAAGLWATAAIGIACGFGFYAGAATGTVVVALTSAILFKLEARGRKKNRRRTIYLEVAGTEGLNAYTDWLSAELKATKIQVMAPRTATPGNVGLEVVFPFVGNEDVAVLLQKLRANAGTVFAMESQKREG